MAASRVQGTGIRSPAGVTSQAVTFAGAVTAGNLIVVGLAAQATSGSVVPNVTVTDSKGNSYAPVGGAVNTATFVHRTALYAGLATTGGTPFTVTVTPDITSLVDIAILEVAGGAGTAESGVNATSFDTAMSTGVIRPSTPGALLVGFSSGTGGTGWSGHANGPGFADVAHDNDAANATIPFGCESLVASSPASATWTIAPADEWVAVGASFPASGTFVAPNGRTIR